MIRCIARWLIAGLLVVLGGCDLAEDVVGETERTVDPRALFPSFDPSMAAEGEAAGEWAFPVCGEPETDDFFNVRQITLGHYFTAEVPSGADWQTQESPGATILIRYPSYSSTPSTVIYAEPMTANEAGIGLQHFQRRVDHRLQLFKPPQWPWSKKKEAEPKALPGAAEQTTDPEGTDSSPAVEGVDDPGAAMPGTDPAAADPGRADPDPADSSTFDPADPTGSNSADTSPTGTLPTDTSPDPTVQDDTPAGTEDPDPTGSEPETPDPEQQPKNDIPKPEDLGLEVGYRSRPGTFSGWRWLGPCGESPSANAPAGDTVLGQASLTPKANQRPKPFLRLSRSHGDWRLQEGAIPVPALQILATVTLPDRRDYGVNLAILCIEAPQCEDATELARFIGSIRVMAAGAGAGTGGNYISDVVRAMAEDVGINAGSGD